MESPGEWIVPLIRSCLLFCEETPSDSLIGVEDDGSNLRFTSPGVKMAVVDCRLDSSDVPTFNLTDGKTQIQAILSSRAFDTYNEEHPDHSLKDHDPIHRKIQLVDFEIVLGYSTSEPNVHLSVKQFDIQWALGKTKILTGKKIKNNKALWNHLLTVFNIINEPRRDGKKEILNISNGSVVSQDDFSFKGNKTKDVVPDSAFSQEVLMSQIPLGYQQSTSKGISDAESGLYRNPTQLLKHLVSNSDPHKKSSFPGTAIRGQFNGNLDFPRTNDEKQMSSTAQKSPGGSIQGLSAVDEAGESTMKDHRSPSRVERGANPEITDSPAPAFVKSPSKQKSPMLGVWGGLTEIHDRDIHIPKDQNALLQDNTCWFPPLPDKVAPSMNVPTSLLSEWNSIVLQRSHLAHEKHQKLETPGGRSSPVATEHRQSTPNPISPALSATSESSSRPLSSWSLSQPNCRPTQIGLPADSPVSAIRRPRDSESLQPKDNGAVDVRILGNKDTGDHRGGNSQQPWDKDLVDNRQLPNHGPIQADKGSKDVDLPMAQAQEPEYDSDDETNESVMDAVVPCPLGYSSQPVSSQVEKEPASSSALCSELKTYGHGGVSGMSGTKPISFCSEKLDTDMASASQQLSSQITSSSSHQIRNTGDSNDNTTKGSSSQEQHYSERTDVTNESNSQVHVRGTQICEDNSTALDTTPNSHGAFVPNSSGSYGRELSVPLPGPKNQDKGMPHSFSACHDSMAIQSYDGNDSPSSQNLTGEDSSRYAPADIAVPSLKREAPIVELQSLPTKRQKTWSFVPEGTGEMGKRVTSNIMSRRESYINSTPNRPDAKHAYEKFKTDYPSYVGDSTHFFKLCAKLQSLRNEGLFKRSPLWDDFIMMHLEQYPDYLQLCRDMGTEVLEYEDYFKSHFVNPIHKKRSLTAASIEASAAQNVTTKRATTSFTTSLVDRLSKFHTNSFGFNTQSNTSSTKSSPLNSATGSPEPNENAQHDQFLSSHPSMPGDRQSPVVETIETIETIECENPTSPASSILSHESLDNDSIAGDPAASQQLQMENELAFSRKTSIIRPGSGGQENEVELSVPKSDHSDDDVQTQEDDDEMETTHETASIELGDDEPSARFQNPPPEAVSEDEDKSENWFASLRHIINPPTGVWSDDPNTPFKMWARADQNVKVEVLQRGGRYREVDEKGVIQQTLTRRQPGR